MGTETDDDTETVETAAPLLKYRCAGSLRKTLDGRVYCNYSADMPWPGHCPGCFRFYDIIKGMRDPKPKDTAADLVSKKQFRPFSTTIPELDAVLGGGIYRDSCILIGGGRGSGKTTMTLQIANGLAQGKHQVIFASGEDGTDQIGRYMQRLEINNPNLTVIGIPDGSNIEKILAYAEEIRPRVVIIDSVQTVYFDDVDGDAGLPAQIGALANALNDFVKIKKIPVILICQLNKDNTDFAGSAKLQYLVDALVVVHNAEENDNGEVTHETKGLREIVINEKNRLGPNDVTALIRLTEKGMVPAKKKSKIFLVDKFDNDKS